MALNGAYNAWKFGNDMKLNLYLIQLEKNSKGNSVHGGSRGFNTQVFETDIS